MTSRSTFWFRRIVTLLAVMVLGLGVALVVAESTGDGDPEAPAAETDTSTTTTEAPIDTSVFSDPARVGEPYGTTVEGLLTFRGNPTRSYYGKGPVPSKPGVAWFQPPKGGLCGESSVGGVTKAWCGSGWTGEPAVFERDGRTWVVFGAYDKAVHFVDAETGADLLPPFPTGDIIKGSVTIDPDGYPIVYTGSRDNFYRAIALDRPGRAVELWKLAATAVSPTKWNNDWDGSGIVVGDYLLEGGENSQFHAVKLNRATGADGLVTVEPQLVWHTPGWDEQLIRDLRGSRPNDVSIENSVAVWRDTVYFANSGGLVQGWDLAPLRSGGTPTRTFRFWTGDDTDASVVVDEEGFLYVASEYERGLQRARDVGQLVKLDPRNAASPIVWSFDDQASTPAGIWSTPALHRDVVYTTTNAGRLVALDRATGAVRWTKELAGPAWQSPVVVDDVLIEGDCNGVLHAWDVSDTTIDPPEVWTVDLGGCIESTPAVWEGRIFVGTRAGKFFALSDDGELSSPTAGAIGGGGE